MNALVTRQHRRSSWLPSLAASHARSANDRRSANKSMTGRFATILAATAVALMLLTGFSPIAVAQSNDELLARIEALEQKLENIGKAQQELEDLKRQLFRAQENSSQALEKAESAEQNASAAMIEAQAESNATIQWHLAGYGTADYTNIDGGRETDAFAAAFNPIFLVGYGDLVTWESELEFSTNRDGSTKTEIEFSNLNLLATDWLTFTAGKFLSPIGDFQAHLHPTWINKLPFRPAGFAEDGGNESLTEVGFMGRGAFFLGSRTANYSIFVGNGPQLSDEAEEGVKYEGSGGDVNDNKAFGGRIGFHPLPYLSVGFSGMRSKVAGRPGSGGSVTHGDLNLQDFDFAFTRGEWDIRGEWVRSDLDPLVTAFGDDEAPAPIPGTTWNSWYAQAAYRLSGLTENTVFGNLEPVFRYSQLNAKGFQEFKVNNEDRWTLGLNYWFGPSLVAKFAFANRDFEFQEDQHVVRLQMSFGF